MFIGASPGSTGGGIKTITFAVLIFGCWAIIKNKTEISVFKRTIPPQILRKAVVIFTLAICWIFLSTFFISLTEAPYRLPEESFFLKNLFEVVSAFGTVGLSCGITPQLSVIGKIIIIITMFVGRIGPLTLALAVARSDWGGFKYPEEKVVVG
jgi:trk system potassium uptake protein TrkH